MIFFPSEKLGIFQCDHHSFTGMWKSSTHFICSNMRGGSSLEIFTSTLSNFSAAALTLMASSSFSTFLLISESVIILLRMLVSGFLKQCMYLSKSSFKGMEPCWSTKSLVLYCALPTNFRPKRVISNFEVVA